MTMIISGSGTIAGLVAGGLPDATITSAELAANAATTTDEIKGAMQWEQ